MINASISPQDRRVLLRKTPAKAMFWSHSRLSNVLQSIVLLLKFRANMYCFAALIYIDELVKASVGKTHRFQAYNSVLQRCELAIVSYNALQEFGCIFFRIRVSGILGCQRCVLLLLLGVLYRRLPFKRRLYAYVYSEILFIYTRKRERCVYIIAVQIVPGNCYSYKKTCTFQSMPL